MENLIEAWIKNYKTSLCGIGIAIMNGVANGTSPKQLAISAGIALLGLFSSDGKTQQAH
jgi:hypothetical protein